jgi:hypothetical protein
MIEELGMKKTAWNCGIALALMALVLAGCLNPVTPLPAKAAGGKPAPYTVSVSLGGDAAAASAEAAARSVSGPTKEQIAGNGISNYVQIAAVDKADGTIAGFAESRRDSASHTAPSLALHGLAYGHTYGILYLQGHWERDYAAETDDNYAYTDNPPTLLGAGYKEVTFARDSSSVAISVWPIYVDTVFTAAGNLSAGPAVTAGRPEAVSLVPAAWTANWKILRGASGTASGLGDLVTAQQAAGTPGDSLVARTLKAVVQADGYGETISFPAFAGNTVTLPLADYTSLSQAGKGGSVNFALFFAPFNLVAGWAGHDDASVFDLSAAPPVWVIRNGINDLAQDDKTDFENFGNVPVETANGNGAVRFTVAPPQSAVEGELLVSEGFYLESSVTFTFTTSGYTGTAQAWYAAVPAEGGNGAPGYEAYTLLGEVPAGTHKKAVTLPETDGGCDVYMFLFKDGKAGAPCRIAIFGGTVVNPDDPRPEDPPPQLFSSTAEVRSYLNYLAANGDLRGGSAGNPVSLPMKMNLGSGTNSLANLLAAIAEKGKYVDLDLSRCTMSGTVFTPNPASNTGKDRVVSLTLPDTAQSIPGDDGPDPAQNPVFKHFSSLKTISGRGITSVGKAAFKGCNALAKANLPKATTIGGYAFGGCNALAEVNLPAVTTIGGYAFEGCNALAEVNLPAATTIDDYAFEGCKTLAAVDMPRVTVLGRCALWDCPALTTVNLPAVTTVPYGAFWNDTSLSTVNLPEAKDIGARAFQNCAALAALSLPKAAVIGDYAFEGCNALTALNLQAAAAIGSYAFFETGTKPLAVTLPVNAPALGACIALSSKYVKTVTVNRPAQSGGYDGAWQAAFKNLFGGVLVILNGAPGFGDNSPFTSVEAARKYMFTESRGSRDNPIPLPMQIYLAGGADELQNLLSMVNTLKKYIALDLSRCSMNGTVFTPNPANSTGKDLVVSLVLPDAAQSITDAPDGSPAFNYFSNLKTVRGSGVVYIGNFAFQNRSSLKEVNLPRAYHVGKRAFWGCSSPFTLNAPEITLIDDYAFLESGVKEALFPNTTRLGLGAFYGAKSLTSVTMTSLQQISGDAFAYCEALVTVNIRQATNIGKNAFLGCISLKRAEFPNVNNAGLGEYAFSRCTSLEYADLSGYKPLNGLTGVFFETGPTPLTIVLNPVGGNDKLQYKTIPGSVSYSKEVVIAIDKNGSNGGLYNEKLSMLNDRYWLWSWFGSSCRLTIKAGPGSSYYIGPDYN